MNAWPILIAAGALTYAMRLSFILLMERLEVPRNLKRALYYVPPAVLSAIIFPELLMPGGTLNVSPGNPRLLAGALAVVIAWRTKNALLTILSGMAALWILQTLI